LVDSFVDPIFVTAPPADSQRIFVVEQAGRVLVLHHDSTQTRPFLDITGKISADGERGLLSLAFHPQYATNGRFYVYLTATNGDLRIVRYNVSATDPDSADPATADTVLKIAHQLAENHNGGQLQFGPDGMLWAATGDGGGAGDPEGNGQNKHALLGKLLRLNVDGASGYTIPADNPFKNDTSAAPEIWSWGLRNPWRFSFDRLNGDLYIADVGQDLYEEVDIAPTAVQRGRGRNYGWNVMEGTHCYLVTTCSATGMSAPILDYPHTGGACSITGGYVYRGQSAPSLTGLYLYSDYCAGFVRAFKFTGNGITDAHDITAQLDPGNAVSSFGEDAKGDVYIMTLNGPVYRIVGAP